MSRSIRRHDGVAVREQLGPTSLVPHVSVSLIVPTRNEAQHIAPLVQRVTAALRRLDARCEIVFVDDSDDETPRAIRAEKDHDIPVRMVHRTRAQRRNGASGAILEGFAEARGSVLVVMDGDLHHPPEILPSLVSPVLRGDAELAVATRDAGGVRADGRGGSARRLAATGARRIVHALVRRSRPVSDPLAGFFVVERSVVDDVDLRADRSEVLLEILAKGHWSRVHEVPYTSSPRGDGGSKPAPRDVIRFAAHLADVGEVPGRRVLRSPISRILLAGVLLALVYGRTLLIFVGGWSPSDAATASCIVPVLAVPLFLRFSHPTARPSPPGRVRDLDDLRSFALLPVAVLALWAVLRYVHVASGVDRIDLLSLPCFAAGVVLLLFGAARCWRLRVPLLFLFLAWPPALRSAAHAASTPLGGATRGVVRPIAAWIGDIVVGPNDFTVANQTIRVAPGWNATAVALVVAIAALVISLLKLRGVARRVAFVVSAAALAWLVNLGCAVFAIFAANVGATGVARSAIGAPAGVVASVIALAFAVTAVPRFARGHLRSFRFRTDMVCAAEAEFPLFR